MDKKFQVEAEVKILGSLIHPNIVKLHGHEVGEDYLSLILEYANDGDLSKKIAEAKTLKTKIPERVVNPRSRGKKMVCPNLVGSSICPWQEYRT